MRIVWWWNCLVNFLKLKTCLGSSHTYRLRSKDSFYQHLQAAMIPGRGNTDGKGVHIVQYFALPTDFKLGQIGNDAAVGLLQRLVHDGKESNGYALYMLLQTLYNITLSSTNLELFLIINEFCWHYMLVRVGSSDCGLQMQLYHTHSYILLESL